MNKTLVIPILRIFDETKTTEFYINFLGFSIDWDHRFGDDFPLYMQISKGGWILHLSEHHGDCCPGSAIMLQMDDVQAYHQDLLAKHYKYAKPGCEATEWDTIEMTITDPFGNRLTFYENCPPSQKTDASSTPTES